MSPKLTRVTAREMISFLECRGFQCVRQSGSHKIYRNQEGIRVTVPFHGHKILHPKIVKQIVTDLRLSSEQFENLL